MRRRSRLLALFGGLLTAALAYGVYYGIRWPRHLHPDWDIVEKIRVSRPDSLALGPDGALRYVTLETIPGFLVELTPAGPKTVFGDFGEPDGLLLLDDTIAVSEREQDGRVMLYSPATARLRVLARLNEPAGLLRQPDGRLVVAQKEAAGRLLEIGDDGNAKTLVEGLRKPEGLCRLADGRIGIAESGGGRILAWGPAGIEVLADKLPGVDRIACGADGSLWAVQGAVRSGRLLRIKDGRQRVIMKRLREPQGVVVAPDGSVYLAETRANRVLHLKPR
jgi:sugar lactone lactonase YvrE